MTIAHVAAQTERVIHLWVDPIYGDDLTAADWNPGGANRCTATEQTPVDVVDAGTGAVLLHASNPFKTITAAVRSIEDSVTVLPFTSPTTGVTWRYAIIHLMPGRYARGDGLSPDNGIRANGETFPIRLPRNVSIQGTSVLNTVVDFQATGASSLGPAFEFGVFVDPSTGSRVLSDHPNAHPYDGASTFINGVTFVGVEGGGSSSEFNERRSAIFLCSDVPSKPTISNCVFVTNEVGIMVSAPSSMAGPQPPNSPEGLPTGFHDGATILNCTFAWNRIGLWSGQCGDSFRGTPPPVQSFGFSRLVILNNIFDSGAPVLPSPMPCGPASSSLFNSWPVSFGPIAGSDSVSGFEGIADVDMMLITDTLAPINFNAFEQVVLPTQLTCNQYDRNVVILPGLPPTDIRGGATLAPVPSAGLNIADITGAGGPAACGSAGRPQQTRGILYVRDLICHGRLSGAWPTDPTFDGSPLDFRLSPSVGLADPAPGQPPFMQNPLIDRGYDFDEEFPRGMSNGLQLDGIPGRLVLSGNSQNTWPFHVMSTDGEGFGNPRIAKYFVGPVSVPNRTDLGADEVGAMIVCGFIHGTDAFLKHEAVDDPIPAPQNRARNNSQLAVLGPANLTLSQPQEQPWYRGFISGNPGTPWPWQDVGTGCPSVPGDLQLPPWFAPWNPQRDATGLGFNYQPAIVAITPHLVPDLHPWWSLGSFHGSSLTLWQSCLGLGNYNPQLYVDPTAHRPNPPGTLAGFVGNVYPPGSPVRVQDFMYLDGFALPGLVPFARWRHWDGCVSGNIEDAPTIAQFDAFCRGGSPSDVFLYSLPGTVVSESKMALRFSLEFDGTEATLLSGYEKNVQSFMVWNTDAVQGGQ
ncbi:MAG: hypothetical protein AB7I19_11960 [Planctomycetota bacterium]